MRTLLRSLAVLFLAAAPLAAPMAQEAVVAETPDPAVATPATEGPAPRVADFQPTGDPVASLVPGLPGRGALRFYYEGVFSQAEEGWPQNLLDVHLLVENRSPDPVIIRAFDLWLTTAGGAVLSEPRLIVDGVDFDKIEVVAGADEEIELLFQLGPTPAFDAFTLNWSARVGDVSRTGVVSWKAATTGYEPPPAPRAPAAEVANDTGTDDETAAVITGEPAPFDTVQTDELIGDYQGELPAICDDPEDPYACEAYVYDSGAPYYVYDPYPVFTYSVHYGVGWPWWGWGWWGYPVHYHHYYPAYHGHYADHYGGDYHGDYYGDDGIRRKEAAIAREAGYEGHGDHDGHHDRALARTDTSLRNAAGGETAAATGRSRSAGRDTLATRSRSTTSRGSVDRSASSRATRYGLGRSASTRSSAVDRRATPSRSQPSIGRSTGTRTSTSLRSSSRSATRRSTASLRSSSRSTPRRSTASLRSSSRSTTRRPSVGRSTSSRSRSSVSRPSSSRSRSSVSRPSSRSSGRSSVGRSTGSRSSSRGSSFRSSSSRGGGGRSMSRGGGSRSGGSRGGSSRGGRR